MLSALIMASVVYYLSPPFELWLDMDFFQQIQTLLLCIIAGAISYFIAIVILGIRVNDFKVQVEEKTPG
jgi:putative peptidoglycan lipid II flippase